MGPTPATMPEDTQKVAEFPVAQLTVIRMAHNRRFCRERASDIVHAEGVRINNRQQAAWRKRLQVFDEQEQRSTTISLFTG
jgi:hypothetical protein